MRALKTFSIIVLLSLGIKVAYAQNNVGIGTNSPDASAVLDVTATDKGLLIPRVALVQTTNPSPVTSPATSLLVYNTATVNDVVPSFYYWDGAQWVQVGAGGGATCVTLDEAYDCGGAGVGRTILATDGAVEINKTTDFASNNYALYSTISSGTSSNPSAGVYVEHSGTQGVAIYGEITNTSNAYSAIQGSSSSNQDNTAGLSGYFSGSAAGYGIYGKNESQTAGSHGIIGINERTAGGWGVEGFGINGVYGRTNDDGGYGLVGYNLSGYTADENGGISVFGNSNVGVFGQSTSANGAGVVGQMSAAYAPGVWGKNDQADGFGVAGIANYGIFGQGASLNGTAWSAGAGVVGQLDPNLGATQVGYLGAYYNAGGAEYAVLANGDMGATGTKAFMIDHPTDPDNKILKHYCAESPEVLNIYRGNIVLNANGEATVELPEYFDALNINFSYQLTAIGAPANGIYIKEEILSNSFKVAGGNANQKISWVVYAERNDLYIQKHPESKQIEIEKGDKGMYLRPELYNQPKEKGILFINKEFKLNTKKDNSLKK